MNVLTVDFETYYDKEYSLSKMTTEAYVRDCRFQVIGASVKRDSAPTEWYTGKDWRGFLSQFNFADSALLAHNTAFDGAILAWRAGIIPKVYLDTMSMARAVLGPDVSVSLASLAEYYGLGKKGTEVVQALGKRREDFTPEDMAAYGGYCDNDVELTYALFKALSRGFPQKELKLIDNTLRMFTMPRVALDGQGLESHLRNVRHTKQTLLDALDKDKNLDSTVGAAIRTVFPAGIDKKDLMSNPKFAELLRTAGVEPPTKISLTTGKEALAFAKTDKEFMDLQEHPNIVVQTLMAARLGTKSTIEETRTEALLDASHRGRMPIQLNYYGAKTGRWSGAGGLNFQNLPNKTPIKSFVRAPDGYVLVGADLSNIELRVGLWLAGEHTRLTMLGNGVDLYKDFAASVFSVPYEEVNKVQRFIGKTSQLSLIYSVGPVKLYDALTMGARNLLGEALDTSHQQCISIVSKYREDYPGVVWCWEQGRQAIHSMAHNQYMEMFNDGFARVQGSEGLALPSGLFLRYNNLCQRQGDKGKEWVYDVRRGVDRIYGGKIFQQYTQAVARCVMAEGMLKIAKQMPIVLTVHDAVYTLVLDGQEENALEQMLLALTDTPEWIPGLPLDAEGGYGATLKDCGKERMRTKQGEVVTV